VARNGPIFRPTSGVNRRDRRYAMRSSVRAVVFAAVLVTLLVAQAAPVTIYVWDKDNGKNFPNPEGGGNIGCEYWLKQALLQNGCLHSSGTTLPADISPYDVIFICTGWC
jgi:hypothetical protein